MISSLLIIFFAGFAKADDTIYPKDAIKYLEKLDCRFSAYAVYTGPNTSSPLGSLKSGQAFSMALCAASYVERGAKEHDYCWLRPVDMKKGVYVGNASYGDAWRDESGPCTKESIAAILNKGSIRGQILTGANKEWKVVSDSRGAAPAFYKLFDRSDVDEKLKKLKYGKYRWNYYDPHDACMDDPGGADESMKGGGAYTYSVVEQTDKKLILKLSSSDGLLMRYFVSKDACESEKPKIKSKRK